MSFRVAGLVLLGATLAACGGGSSAAPTESAATGYRFVAVASGLDQPVHVTTPRGESRRLYVVEQPGRIRIVQGGRIVGTFLDISSRVVCCGEQGLLSVAFHPRYSKNRRYFVYYTAPANRVVEYRGKRAVRTLLNVADPYSNHNGGQLAFGPDGRLYVGMGDAGSGGDPENRAQNMASPFGKLMSINVDARGAGWRKEGLGLRNPWRFGFDRTTGDLYIGDVGQNAWEEVNYVPRRSPGLENYGWDVYEGRAKYEDKQPSGGRLVFPIVVYPLGSHCAVVGGTPYRGRAVASARGRYFYGDNCSGAVWSLRVVGGKARGVRRESFSLSGLSSFGENGRGELFATTLGGRVYQLRSG
jgi:glucose/arabinose dehydrogenase